MSDDVINIEVDGKPVEREVRLNNWISKGVPLNAEITAATLESIFTVPGPLHDGAVIISQEKIAAAAVILPITDREELGYILGTRHRAAIGLSEDTDAVAVVVSEETGTISLASDGRLNRHLDETSLAQLLRGVANSVDTRNAELARDDRPVDQHAPAAFDDGGGQHREMRHGRLDRVAHQDLAVAEPPQVGPATQDASHTRGQARRRRLSDELTRGNTRIRGTLFRRGLVGGRQRHETSAWVSKRLSQRF